MKKLLYTLQDESRTQGGPSAMDIASHLEKSLDFKLPEMEPSSTLTTDKASRTGSDLNRPNQRRLLNQSVVVAKGGLMSPGDKSRKFAQQAQQHNVPHSRMYFRRL